MIDFVRVVYRNTCFDNMVSEDRERFPQFFVTKDIATGEFKYPKKSNIGSMEVNVYEDRVEVKNSIHVLHNFRYAGESHNHNDFTYSALVETIDYLKGFLPKFEVGNITSLEFGLNVNTSIPAKDIIMRNTVMHNSNFHSENNKFRSKGELKRFTYSQYQIKMYDKQFQFGLEDNTLRFEIVFKGNLLRKLGVTNINSLLDKRILRKLFIYLSKRFDEMVIIDDNYTELNGLDKCDLYTLTNQLHWKNYLSGKTPQTRYNHKRKLLKLIHKNGLDNLKQEIKTLLWRKFVHLMNN